MLLRVRRSRSTIEGMQRLAPLLDDQHGIISRQQVLEVGLTENDLRRLIRQRHLVVVHPGVYANHTGLLTWHQRAWAAVLHAWPAALSHQSAMRAADGPGRRRHDDDGPIHVAIDRRRALSQPDGTRVHHLADLSRKVQWNRTPPRLRVEEAALDLAAEARSELDAIAVLSGVVSSKLTTAGRLLEALAQRSRIARRAFLTNVLHDVEAGTCSVLEHGYLTRVERAHGLPRGLRQAPAVSSGPIRRDVLYAEFGQVVELDGQVFHTGTRNRDRDLDRDLDAAVDRLSGIRLGWGQVFDRPCRTAQRVAVLLRRRGWEGEILTCDHCSADGRGLQARGDSDPRLSA